jgi:hypothetical protein
MGFFGAVVFGGLLTSIQVPAADDCKPRGSYGYVYNGVSYDNGAAVEIAETGFFRTYGCDVGELCGHAKATFRFPHSQAVGGALWVLLDLDFDNGEVQASGVGDCTGTVEFLATGTVLQSQPTGLEGQTLFTDQHRSIAYTVSGALNGQVDLISTSPDSILAGTAHRQIPR